MREFIQKLFEEKAKNDKNSQTLARTLNGQITDTLGGSKYINELLQNADDAGDKERNVEFILTEKYLIFSHDGNHFSQKDVEAISDSRNNNRDKLSDPNTTGQKGIGFGSVFNNSDTVFILSDKATFKFDKHHALWKNTPDVYPWTIIPIYVDVESLNNEENPDYLDNGIKEFYDSNRVIFIFKIKSKTVKESIKEHLEALVQNTSILIFQRHTKSISYENRETGKTVKIERDKSKVGMCILSRNNNVESTWLTHQITYKIPKQTIEFLEANNMPKKFSKDGTFVVEYAAPDTPELITQNIPNNVLYCFFPTQIKLNMPFIFNANFLLNAERTQLNDSQLGVLWNETILGAMINGQFYWFEKLAKRTQHFTLPFSLIADPKKITWPSQVAKVKCTSFEKNFNDTIVKSKIVVSKTKKLWEPSRCCIDIHGFIAEFGAAADKEGSVHEAYNTAQKKMMVLYGVQEFNFNEIIKRIVSDSFKVILMNPEKNLALLQLLFRISNNNPEYLAQLKNKQIVLTSSKGFAVSDETLIPDEKLKYRFQKLNLNMIHSVFMGPISRESDFKAWLENLGVEEISIEGLIKIINKKKQKELVVQFCRLILNYMDELNDEDWTRLKKLNLCTVDGKFILPENCYLNDVFEPEVKIGSLNQYYSRLITPDFIDDNQKIKQWKMFFIKIGVAETLKPNNVPTIISSFGEDGELHYKLLVLIFQHCRNDATIINRTTCSKLLIKTQDEGFAIANQCYLADRYEPNKQIEEYGNGINFVSEDYIHSEEQTEEWKKLFCAIGVYFDLRIQVEEQISYSAAFQHSKEYVDFLWNDSTKHSETPELGVALFPAATRGYTSQHYIKPFHKIDFYQQIRGTKIFWELVQEYWNQIYISLSKTHYHTQRSSRPVISPIHFEAVLSINKLHPGVEISNLYPPNLRNISYGLLSFANIDVDLTQEQIEVFGFKKYLTKDDVLKLLLHYQSLPFTAELFENLKILFKNIINNNQLSFTPEELENIKLPNEKGKFIAVSQLCCLLVESQELSLKDNHERFLKKPNEFSAEDLLRICTLFGITPLQKNSFQVCEQKPAANEDELKQKLSNNLCYLVTAELLRSENIVSDEIIINLFKNYSAKLGQLTFKPLTSFSVQYDNFFKQDVRCWLIDNTLFYRGIFDRFTSSKVWFNLKNYFSFSMSFDDLENLMSGDETIAAWIEEGGVKVEAIYSTVKKIYDAFGGNFEEKEPEVPILVKKRPVRQEKNTDDKDSSEKISNKKAKEDELEKVQEESSTPHKNYMSSGSHVLVNSSYTTNVPTTSVQTKDVSQPDSHEPVSKKTKSSSEKISIEEKRAALNKKMEFLRSRSAIGDKGEAHTFNYLLMKYSKKPKYVIKATDSGFVATTAEGKTKELIWNKKLPNANSFPYDMKFVKTDTNGGTPTIQYIEIKTTSEVEPKGIFSEEEWKLIKAYPKNHAVYFVTDINSDSPPSPKKEKDMLGQKANIEKKQKKEYSYKPK